MVGEIAPWQWDEATWRGHVGHVRAGRPLLPGWPGGARVAVALSFDSDHETIALRNGETGPGEAQGRSAVTRRRSPTVCAFSAAVIRSSSSARVSRPSAKESRSRAVARSRSRSETRIWSSAALLVS